MNRGEKLLLGGAVVAVAGMVALAAPLVVSVIPVAEAAAEQTHTPVPEEMMALIEIPQSCSSRTEEFQ